MRFLQLYITNQKPNQRRTLFAKKLSKCGWVDEPGTGRRGHDGPSWTPSSHTCSISFDALFIILDSRYVGYSLAQRYVEGLRSKTLKLLEFVYWTNSLNCMKNQQDRPSWLWRSVTHSVTPHLVRIPHLPSAVALRCHLRTVTGMTNHHKLRRWYSFVFLAQKPPHYSFRQISCK